MKRSISNNNKKNNNIYNNDNIEIKIQHQNQYY